MVTLTLFFKSSFIWLKLYLKYVLDVSSMLERTLKQNLLGRMLEYKVLSKNMYVMLTRNSTLKCYILVIYVESM